MNLLATRRSLLAGLAASSFAAVAKAEQASSEEQQENAKLIKLGDELQEISAKHTTARQERLECYRSAMKMWPKPDEELTGWSKYVVHDYEKDVEGRSIAPQCNERGSQYVQTSNYFANSIANTQGAIQRAEGREFKAKNYVERDRRWKKSIREDRAKLKKAKAYETECARIRRSSGIDQRIADEALAREALATHITAVMKEPAHTMLGVVIKAQALEAWGKADLFFQRVNPKADLWASEMAKAVIQQGEASA